MLSVRQLNYKLLKYALPRALLNTTVRLYGKGYRLATSILTSLSFPGLKGGVESGLESIASILLSLLSGRVVITRC